MPVTNGYALREVRKAFGNLKEQMMSMHSGLQMRPNDVGGVIKHLESTDGVMIECAPVVCRLPERASQADAKLYVVFRGKITFSGQIIENQLLTISYVTDFGYFVVRNNKMTHVLGGHYDFAPSATAHPHAHLQLRSQAELYEFAQENFHSVANVPLDQDLMEKVLSGVRSPTAQMDFLSFLLQVCADHLVDGKSPTRVVSAFERLSSSCSPVLGYQAGLNQGCGCHRSPHWYTK